MKIVKYLLVACGLMLFTGLANAQSSNDVTTEVAQMTKVLKLTDAQQETVTTILQGIQLKNEQVMKDSNFNETEKKSIISSNQQSKDNMLKEVLTPQQYETYLKMKK